MKNYTQIIFLLHCPGQVQAEVEILFVCLFFFTFYSVQLNALLVVYIPQLILS